MTKKELKEFIELLKFDYPNLYQEYYLKITNRLKTNSNDDVRIDLPIFNDLGDSPSASFQNYIRGMRTEEIKEILIKIEAQLDVWLDNHNKHFKSTKSFKNHLKNIDGFILFWSSLGIVYVLFAVLSFANVFDTIIVERIDLLLGIPIGIFAMVHEHRSDLKSLETTDDLEHSKKIQTKRKKRKIFTWILLASILVISVFGIYRFIFGEREVYYENTHECIFPDDTIHSYSITTKDKALPVPTRQGYNFDGWYTNLELKGKVMKILPDISFSYKIKLYAKWILESYSITYELNGGTNHPKNIESYNAELDNISLYDPSRNGYTFDGWYYDEECVGEQVDCLESNLGKNLVLYAKWNANTYNLTLDYLDSDTKGIEALEVTYGKKVLTLSTPTKKGYSFIGWALSTDDAVVFNNGDIWTISEDVTLIPKWEMEKYSIKLNYIDNTGKLIIDEILCGYNQIIQGMITPIRKGYAFIGWFDTEDQKYNNGDICDFASSKTLTAKWKLIQYNISYELNGQNVEAKDLVDSYNVELEPFMLNSPIRRGYTFAGWYYDSNFTGNRLIKIDTTLAKDLYLYAKWTANSYILSFESLYGENKSMTVYTGDKVSFPIPVESDLFLGWSTEIDSSTKVGLKENQIDWTIVPDNLGDNNTRLSLYAIWEEIPENWFSVEKDKMGNLCITGLTELWKTYSGALDKNKFILPNKYNGIDIVGISEGAFENNTSIIQVFIPNSIEYISNNAFKGCVKLNSIYGANGLIDLGNKAFSNTLWWEKDLGEYKNGFLVLGQIIVKYNRTATMNITESSFPSNVTVIGPNAFENINNSISETKRIVIPNIISKICDNAFINSGFTDITLPNNVEYGTSILKGTSLDYLRLNTNELDISNLFGEEEYIYIKNLSINTTLSTINFIGNNISLINLNLSNKNLTKVELLNFKEINYLDLSNNKLNAININGISINSLSLNNNLISTLNVTHILANEISIKENPINEILCFDENEYIEHLYLPNENSIKSLKSLEFINNLSAFQLVHLSSKTDINSIIVSDNITTIYIIGEDSLIETNDIQPYIFSLSMNNRNKEIDIFVNDAVLTSLENKSIVQYTGTSPLHLYLNNAILKSSSCEQPTLNCVNLDLFTYGYCEIIGADSNDTLLDGGVAVKCDSIRLNIYGTLNIRAGSGAAGSSTTSVGQSGGHGTSGGTAIESDSITFKNITTSAKISIIAGSGGNGGNGGKGEEKTGNCTAGSGGNGGNGGNSGHCIVSNLIYFDVKTIESIILLKNGNGGNGGNGGKGGYGNQATWVQSANGGKGGKGGNGGVSKSPIPNTTTLTGGTIDDFKRILVNDLASGGLGGNGGDGGDVHRDAVNKPTRGSGGNGGNGGNIEELSLKYGIGKTYALSTLSTEIKPESSKKGIGGAEGGETKGMGGSESGSPGTDGTNGTKIDVYISLIFDET